MRITFLTTQINLVSGGGSHISPYLKALSMHERGHSVKLITLFPENNNFPTPPPFEVKSEPTSIKNWLALQIRIFFILKKYEKQSDIFAFEGEPFIWGAGAYRLLRGKTPVILHLNGLIFAIFEHGTTYGLKYIRKSLKRKITVGARTLFEKLFGSFLANRIDAFTADSPLVKEWHVRFGFLEKKITVLPAFVDLQVFLQRTKEMPPFQKNSHIHILYVGRLVPEKSVETLIEATAKLPDDLKKQILIHIIGRGPQEKILKNLVIHHQLDKIVNFYPWMNKKTLASFYHASDIFIHPARWPEPLGLTIIEAMATGLPVIVPEVSGSAWAAGNGGITFKNGNADDLKIKMEYLIKNPEQRKKIAERAGLSAQKFDYRGSITVLEKLIHGATI